MPLIVQAGLINPAAGLVPDAYVQINPPGPPVLNAAPTNVIGGVGFASWGPVNLPQVVATSADLARIFGPVVNRKFDLATLSTIFLQQGANNQRLVRVTDGTDLAASLVLKNCSGATSVGGTGFLANDTITLPSGVVLTVNTVVGGNPTVLTVTSAGLYTTPPTGTVFTTSGAGTGATFTLTSATALTLTSKYTGTFGNQMQATVFTGSSSTIAAPTWKVILQIPGQSPEVYDNIGGIGNAAWVAAANAINNGINAYRGPSNLATAAAGAATGAPSVPAAPALPSSLTFSAGTDGAATPTVALMVGADQTATAPRKGLYALRGTGCSLFVLADSDDTTQWAAQAGFASSEGMYGISNSPAGDAPLTFQTTKQTAGVDNYDFCPMFGDWIWWFDQANQLQRLVAPAAFKAGRLAASSPQNSGLNQPVTGVIGTQRSVAGNPYSNGELQILMQAGGDVITNPIPGSASFGIRLGRNSSSDFARHTDVYTRVTNFLAQSIAFGGVAQFLGKPINPTTMRQAKTTVDAFAQVCANQGIIWAADGSTPWVTQCDASNNPTSQTQRNILQIDVQFRYGEIVEDLLVNLTGGSTVTIVRNSQPVSQ